MAFNFNKTKQSLSNTIKERGDVLSTDDVPKGWIDINVHLPMMLASDLLSGGTTYEVRYADGTEGVSVVIDHNTWNYHAQERGITHWLNK